MAIKKKNPHAVALGRKGGKVKGVPKGFAGMDPGKASIARIKSIETRRLKNS